MSLSSFLSSAYSSELKKFMVQNYPLPPHPVGQILVPHEGEKYGILGTAFDYLLRWGLEKRFGVIAKEMDVPERVLDAILRIKEENNYTPEKFNELIDGKIQKLYSYQFYYWCNDETHRYLPLEKIVSIFEEIKRTGIWKLPPGITLQDAPPSIFRFPVYAFPVDTAYQKAKENREKYLQGKKTEQVYEACIVYAILDTYYRCGKGIEFLNEDWTKEIKALTSLYQIIPWPRFKGKIEVGPDFGTYSGMMGGADADLRINKTLIEVKTSIYAKVERRYLHQLLCYAAFSCATGHPINKIGIYFSRMGVLDFYPVDKKLLKEILEKIEKLVGS